MSERVALQGIVEGMYNHICPSLIEIHLRHDEGITACIIGGFLAGQPERDYPPGTRIRLYGYLKEGQLRVFQVAINPPMAILGDSSKDY